MPPTDPAHTPTLARGVSSQTAIYLQRGKQAVVKGGNKAMTGINVAMKSFINASNVMSTGIKQGIIGTRDNPPPAAKGTTLGLKSGRGTVSAAANTTKHASGVTPSSAGSTITIGYTSNVASKNSTGITAPTDLKTCSLAVDTRKLGAATQTNLKTCTLPVDTRKSGAATQTNLKTCTLPVDTRKSGAVSQTNLNTCTLIANARKPAQKRDGIYYSALEDTDERSKIEIENQSVNAQYSIPVSSSDAQISTNSDPENLATAHNILPKVSAAANYNQTSKSEIRSAHDIVPVFGAASASSGVQQTGLCPYCGSRIQKYLADKLKAEKK